MTTTTTTRMYHWGRGLELRIRRERIGMSMDELSDALGVHRRTVQRWASDMDPIPATIWAALDAIEERIADEVMAAADAIMDALEAAAWPSFFVVPMRTKRDLLAAEDAQERLDENGIATRLVTAHGMDRISDHGYEDPLVTDTP